MFNETPNLPVDDPCDDISGRDLSKWCKKPVDK